MLQYVFFFSDHLFSIICYAKGAWTQSTLSLTSCGFQPSVKHTYIYIYDICWVHPNTCNSQKKGFPYRDPPKGAQSKLFFLGTGNRGLEWHDLCVSIFHLPDLLALSEAVPRAFGGLPRAILGAPVRAFWWVASCHFGCSSSCFLVGCLVPFWVLQFVLFGGLPRAILRAPVRAFWWVASCHFACSSSCFLVGCLVPFWVLQFVLFGGLPRAILRAPVRAFW